MCAQDQESSQYVRVIPVQEAVGSVLCHDITRIVPGGYKGPAFRKGHIVTQADIPELLRVGKEHLYVLVQQPGMVHEEEAAIRMARAASGGNLRLSEPSEGKVTFYAACQGLLRVNAGNLECINSLGEIAFATMHSLQEVSAGQPVAGARVIPLMVEDAKIRAVEQICEAGPIVEVIPFRSANIGVVITGSEIYHGRIKDAFGPVLREKFQRLGSRIVGERLGSDDVELTRAAILEFEAQGADMIVLTGGMSVDPDDQTPASIRAAGAHIVSYGAPTFPGAMFLLGYLETERGRVHVLGLPGCVMYHKSSIFDLIVPRLLAGLEVSKQDIERLGHGGFCAACPVCRYPVCPFGK